VRESVTSIDRDCWPKLQGKERIVAMACFGPVL
jgi:hypothetical protein